VVCVPAAFGNAFLAGMNEFKFVLGSLLNKRQAASLATSAYGSTSFNLLSIWQLDGGRGFTHQAKPQRSIAAFVEYSSSLPCSQRLHRRRSGCTTAVMTLTGVRGVLG
jgi:hypothetical protein